MQRLEAEVPTTTREAWLACGRELLSLDYPRALTARPRGGVVGRASAGNARPPSCHSEKRAMFTQMRAETRSVASLPFAFRFTHTRTD